MYFFLDDVPLMDHDKRWYVTSNSIISTPVTVRSSALTVPGVSGSTFDDYLTFDTPQISLEMMVAGKTRDELMKNFSLLTGQFARARELKRKTEHDCRYAGVELVSVSEPEYLNVTKKLRATYILRLPEAVWRYATATWREDNVSSDGTVQRVTTLDNSSAPIVDARITLHGPLTSPKLTDVNSENWIEIGQAISSGDHVVIDCKTFTVLENGSADISSSLNTSGGPYCLPLTPRTMFTDPGYTVYEIALDDASNNTVRVDVEAEGAYLV